MKDKARKHEREQDSVLDGAEHGDAGGDEFADLAAAALRVARRACRATRSRQECETVDAVLDAAEKMIRRPTGHGAQRRDDEGSRGPSRAKDDMQGVPEPEEDA